MKQPPSRWENECEGLFREFRLACVHLRKDRLALDSLENKQEAWHFICKFCRERPFWHDRCNEVLRILMLSDDWVKQFLAAGGNINDLPQSIVEDFRKRVEEVDPGQPKAEPAPRAVGSKAELPPEPPAGPLPSRPAGLAVVVQRCAKARALLDEGSGEWGEIGQGLLVSVSFAKKATEERVRSAARFLLTAKLSTASAAQTGRRPSNAGKGLGGDAESVVELARKGEDQGILIMPQASLVANLGGDNLGLEYDDWAAKDAARSLYMLFLQALREQAQELVEGGAQPRVPKIVAASFSGRQPMTLESAGPFMHSFNF